jgi:hypothetical protein
MRWEPRVPHALSERSWAPLVQKPVAVAVVVAIVVSPASSVAVSAWAVLVAAVVVVAVPVVVDARSQSASFNSVPGVAVGPETAPDR